MDRNSYGDVEEKINVNTKVCNSNAKTHVDCDRKLGLGIRKYETIRNNDRYLSPIIDMSDISVFNANGEDLDTSMSFGSVSSLNDINDVTSLEREKISSSAELNDKFENFFINHRRHDTRLNTDKSSDGDVFEEDNIKTTCQRKKRSPRRIKRQSDSNNLKESQHYCSSTYPSSMTSLRAWSSSQNLSDDILEQNLKAEHLKSSKPVKKNALLQQETKEYKSDSINRSSNPTHFQSIIPQQYKVVFNVAGRLFDVDVRNLDKFPETLLGNSASRAQFFDWDKNEYFLDRHRNIFEVIVDFYENGGVLKRPDELPIDIFINEIKFYQFSFDTLKQYLKEEGILVETKVKPLPKGKLKQFIWNLFEDHNASYLAQSVTLISAIVIAISVTVFCLETIPSFESLGNELEGGFQPALNTCQTYLNERYYENRTNTSFNNLFESFQEEVSSDVFDQLKFTLLFCVSNFGSKLMEKYVYKRCLIETIDEKNNLNKFLNTTTENTKSHFEENLPLQTKRKLRHRQVPNTENSAVTNLKENKKQEEIRKHKNTDQASSFICKINNGKKVQNCNITKLKVLQRENNVAKFFETGRQPNRPEFPNELIYNKITQNVNILKKLCPLVNDASRRSPVYWLVLEAKLGSLAGILFLTESACIIWFLIELSLRFYACPSKLKFCKDFLNIVDTLAILPYFITLIVMSFETKMHMRPQTATILRTIRLIRMLRVLKLSRYSRGFRILGLTLLRSTRVLFLLVGFEVVLAVTFSSIAYFVEYGAPNTQFLSIPDAFWWALITMTTVGYGDVAPVTLFGKITGAGCAILGILCISFPVPVIVSNFNYLYNLDKDDCKLVPEDLMTDQKDSENNVEKFQENLFNAVRKTASSEEPSPSHSASIMWNNVRRQTRKMSVISVDAKSDRSKLSKTSSANHISESSNLLTPPNANDRSKRKFFTDV